MTEKQLMRREWLVRCEYDHNALAVCSVEACAGEVAVFTPDHSGFFLDPRRARDFIEAVEAALRQAESDTAKQSAAPAEQTTPG